MAKRYNEAEKEKEKMIKFGVGGYKIIKKEFDKGNNLWFIKIKDRPLFDNRTELALIVWMKGKLKGKMGYISYNIDGTARETARDKDDIPYETEIKDWNFNDFDFYILTKKEAKPYFKIIMMNNIIEQNKIQKQI